ncbi:hypothetical protein BIW11_07810 [Tropilaelaps mercedesae]|uniref:Uncharacterized protein n=1 Tax=Tropilaelaps mercedesae TaxID=418985 RepID=A0A1V9XSA6_9ACAR|nr:hypothetical protein BIW11_07810 [Tropilaelaps mercedesae]
MSVHRTPQRSQRPHWSLDHLNSRGTEVNDDNPWQYLLEATKRYRGAKKQRRSSLRGGRLTAEEIRRFSNQIYPAAIADVLDLLSTRWHEGAAKPWIIWFLRRISPATSLQNIDLADHYSRRQLMKTVERKLSDPDAERTIGFVEPVLDCLRVRLNDVVCLSGDIEPVDNRYEVTATKGANTLVITNFQSTPIWDWRAGLPEGFILSFEKNGQRHIFPLHMVAKVPDQGVLKLVLNANGGYVAGRGAPREALAGVQYRVIIDVTWVIPSERTVNKLRKELMKSFTDGRSPNLDPCTTS